MTECSHPCGGHCCRDFFLPFGPQELAEQAERFKDGPQVAAMVVYLKEDSEGHHYTCKNLQPDTGICGIYEARPGMCRNYPYGQPCRYPDCESPEAKGLRLLPLAPEPPLT